MERIMRRSGWTVILGLALALGCEKVSEQKYTPSEANAREALESALKQWRDGQAKPAQFPLGKVKVDVADEAWSGGKKIDGFEIVGEESGGSGPRVFTVKLKSAKGEQTVKYYVFGIDPLMVYSEADYHKLSGGHH
jgi:hypothetical protein